MGSAMKCFLTVIFGISLLELSSSNVIPSQVRIHPEVELGTKPINDTLIFAHVIFRHGDRNAGGAYPNDPNKNEDEWPGGFGQLSNKGKTQMFNLGQYMRRRYGRILNEKYSPNQVYTQSTDFDRSIMSAQAAPAGLFPPENEQIWNENILWQPIPVHSVPIDIDIVIALKSCTKFKALFMNYLMKSPEMLQIYAEYGHLFPIWTEKSGMNITSPVHVFMLYDVLRNEREHNKTIPDWAREASEPNGPMQTISLSIYKGVTGTPEMARLVGGFLIKEMLERFSQKIQATLKTDLKVWLYSAHDLVIVNVLHTLGVFEPHIPPPASSLFFELYKNYDNEHYLKLFYRKSTEEEPLPLDLPGCGEKCPLDKFRSLYKSIIPGEYKAECLV